jgi:hypothetical protein
MGLDVSKSVTFIPCLYISGKFILLVTLMHASLETTSTDRAFQLKTQANTRLPGLLLLLLALYENFIDGWIFQRLNLDGLCSGASPVSTHVVRDVLLVLHFFYFSHAQYKECTPNHAEFLLTVTLWILASILAFVLELLSCRNEGAYTKYFGGAVRTVCTQVTYVCVAALVSGPCMLGNLAQAGVSDITLRALIYTLFVTSRSYVRAFMRQNSMGNTAPNAVSFSFVFVVDMRTVYAVVFLFVASHLALLTRGPRLEEGGAPGKAVDIDPLLAAKLKEMEAGMGKPAPGRRRNIF